MFSTTKDLPVRSLKRWVQLCLDCVGQAFDLILDGCQRPPNVLEGAKLVSKPVRVRQASVNAASLEWLNLADRPLEPLQLRQRAVERACVQIELNAASLAGEVLDLAPSSADLTSEVLRVRSENCRYSSEKRHHSSLSQFHQFGRHLLWRLVWLH